MLNPAPAAISIERTRPSMNIANASGIRAASVAPRLVAPIMASAPNHITTQSKDTFR